MCVSIVHLIIFKRLCAPNKQLALIALLLLLTFSRADLSTGDFINYRQSIEFDVWDLYYAKEFVFWGAASAINAWTGSFETTIYIMDAIIATLLILALPDRSANIRSQGLALPAIVLLSFPVLMGFANVYRQLTGLALFFFALNLYFQSNRSAWKTHLFFIISCLSHNVFIAFYALFIIGNIIKKIKFQFALILTCVLAISLVNRYILPDLTDTIGLYGLESGGDTRLILLSMNFVLIFIYASIKTPLHASTYLKEAAKKIDQYQFQVWGLLVAITIFIAFFTESTAERLLTLCFITTLYLIIFKYSHTGQARISRSLFISTLVIVAVLPTFVASSASSLIFP